MTEQDGLRPGSGSCDDTNCRRQPNGGHPSAAAAISRGLPHAVCGRQCRQGCRLHSRTEQGSTRIILASASPPSTDTFHEVGDTQVPFTIQAMSKPFVFALALDPLGAAAIEAVIGVEPSGDAFNSIWLNADNKPFNAMVNAGLSPASGLIVSARARARSSSSGRVLSRFAGRDLGVDEAVYASERATGDRNRAIGYLLAQFRGAAGRCRCRARRLFPPVLDPW